MSSYPIEKPLEGLESFYDEFILNREAETIELEQHLTQNNFIALAKMAHKWKGFAAPYGFGHLATIAEELETAATHHDPLKSRELLISVKKYLAHKRSDQPI